MNVNFDIKLSKSQKEVYDLVHNDDYKYYTVVFSRQSGKTVLMLVLCIEWLFSKNNTIAYVCRNFTLAKKLYKELIKLIPKEYIKSSNGSDFYIETKLGSTLNFYSAEQGSSLRGQTFTQMICDEFAFHKQEQTDGTHLWNDILSPTLKTRGKKCIFVSTPLGKNNILYDMYLRGLSDEYPQYISIIKTIYDDGFVTPEQIEEIRKSIPETSFNSEFLCQFIDDALTFFQGFDKVYDTNMVYNEYGKEWIGIDLSADGSDETILTRVNGQGQIKQHKIEGSLDNKYREIANLINTINPIATYIENNGIGAPMINEIKKLVKHKGKIYEWSTSNSSKEEIISNLAMLVTNKDIVFNDNELYSQFGTFICKITKTKKLSFAAQDGKKDDRIMSLAIALECRRRFKNISNVTVDNFIKPNFKPTY